MLNVELERGKKCLKKVVEKSIIEEAYLI